MEASRDFARDYAAIAFLNFFGLPPESFERRRLLTDGYVLQSLDRTTASLADLHGDAGVEVRHHVEAQTSTLLLLDVEGGLAASTEDVIGRVVGVENFFGLRPAPLNAIDSRSIRHLYRG